MNLRENKRLYVLFLGALLAGLLAACGASEETRPDTAGAPPSAAAFAGIDICTTCHSVQTAEWLATPHANLDPSNPSYLGYAGNPDFVGTIYTWNDNTCGPCHNLNDDGRNLALNYTGDVDRPVVGCESCHGEGSNHNGPGGAIGPSRLQQTTFGAVQVSGWVRTCNDCHELLDTTTGGIASATHRNGGVPPNTDPDTNNSNTISDTHFATGGDYTGANNANNKDVTGYSMDYSSESACMDCHNPHKNIDVNREWATSAHADTTKLGAWAHYNWSCDVANCTAAGSRTSCQRCHTTTGFAAHANALETGNTTLAAAILAGTSSQLTFDSVFKPEMLECKGCHKDNKGTLRDPGAYNAQYGGSITHQYADLDGSNVCMPCHTGRNSGAYIKTLASGFSSKPFRDVDTHYLSAGGTMYAVNGYEFAGRNYSNPTAFKHDKIGTTELSIDGGTNGPCVGCHMYQPGARGNHTFRAVGKDVSGMITGITSSVCFNVTCHPGSNFMLAEIAETEKVDFEESLDALARALSSQGFTPVGYVPGDLSGIAYPYFSNTSWDSSDDTGNTEGKNNMGAALNFSMLHHEPGAYVHNNRYARRLIYDSIDWIDNKKLDYSTGAYLDTLPDPPQTEAKRFLLNGGTTTGNSAERP